MEPLKPATTGVKQLKEDSAHCVEPLDTLMKKKRERDLTSQTASAVHWPVVITHQPSLQLAWSAAFSHGHERKGKPSLMQIKESGVNVAPVKPENKPLIKESGVYVTPAKPSLMQIKESGVNVAPVKPENKPLIKESGVYVTPAKPESEPFKSPASPLPTNSVAMSNFAVTNEPSPAAAKGVKHLEQPLNVNDRRNADIEKAKIKDKGIRNSLAEPASPFFGAHRDGLKLFPAVPLERKPADKRGMMRPPEQGKVMQESTKMTYSFRSWGQGHVDISDIRGQFLFQPSDTFVRERLAASLHRDGTTAWQMSGDSDPREQSSRRQQQENNEEES